MFLKSLAWLTFATVFLSGCAQHRSAPKVRIHGSPADFTQRVPPIYDATARSRRYEGHGEFQIEYKDGQIVDVFAVKSAGIPYLDAMTIKHIRSYYRVKPGVSGTVRQRINYHLRATGPKTASVPPFRYDAEAINRRYQGQGKFQITYKSGKIVSVTTLKSTGVAYLDAKTIRDIYRFARLKPNASGTVVLPITYRLTRLPEVLTQ